MKVAEKRRTGVSSSKISAILNRNKYRDVIDQWMQDTKRKKPEFTNTAQQKMSMGTKMEGIIKELVEEHFGIALTVDKNRYVDDGRPYMSIEFDALDYRNQVVYEFKNTEMDENHIYETYYSQVQFAMFMIGWNKARICYLRNGWDLGYVDVERDDNFIEHMLEAAARYNHCLVEDIQPDPEEFNEIANNIKFYQDIAYLKPSTEVADLTVEEVQALYEWAEVRKEIDKLQIEEARYKGMFADKFGKYKDEALTYSQGEYVRKGGYDLELLKKDYPDIDFEKYRKPDNKYTRQMLKYKNVEEEEDII
jgi:predicted phage-related endonuclease